MTGPRSETTRGRAEVARRVQADRPPGGERAARASGSSGGRFDRLRRSADFRRIQGGGRKFRSANLLVLAVRAGASSCRVGLTVSRKVGGAVVRNRVKRWLRESLRAVGPPSVGAWDLVVIAHPSAASAGFAALRAELADIVARIRA